MEFKILLRGLDDRNERILNVELSIYGFWISLTVFRGTMMGFNGFPWIQDGF